MRQLKASASNIETRSPPTLARCFPRSFTFYVAFPNAPFGLSVCPSMSLPDPARIKGRENSLISR
jgi:hypothetical protein